jgi:YHYH protein
MFGDDHCDMTNCHKYRVRAVAAVFASGLALAGTGTIVSNAATQTTVKKKSATTKKPATTKKATAATAAMARSIVNTWSGAKVDPAKLPIGDSSVSTTEAGVGTLFACRAGNPNAPGAWADGPWLNAAAGTWDSTTKLAVKGEVSWPTAKYTETVSAGKRILTSNNLPVDMKSGTFPIAADDPSYAYDRNPGKITSTDTTLTFVETGTIAAKISCLSEGAVGMLRNGVKIFNSLDARGLDAVAHESQDLCQGHPAMTTYHYHNIPSCLLNAATGPSTVVGWISDGFPVVVERDASGALPTNADLDECHGRTSPILLNGKVITTYHYSATLEFPYFIGCYKGTATQIPR